MPYIILSIGLLIGLVALYRFFMRANVAQIKALFFTAAICAVVIAAFYLAVSGRLPAAIAVGGALIPLLFNAWRKKQNHKEDPVNGAGKTMISTRKDALDVLGLKDGATEDDIKAAHKKLMQKLHPDQDGSEFLSAQLNQARDILLKK